jgi:8-oxo-dGTP pyrophosphatase MutT (NUDIX family)
MTNISRLLEQLCAIAHTGYNYSADLPYHRALYQQILDICFCSDLDKTLVGSTENWKFILKELGVITPKVGVVIGIVHFDKSLLLLQRPSGRWCLPCGYADIGETPEVAALREAREETSLEIELRYFLGLTTTSDDLSIPFMWEAVYIAESKTKDIQLSHEHISMEWMKKTDERLWHSTHRTHVERIFTFLNNPDIFPAINVN